MHHAPWNDEVAVREWSCYWNIGQHQWNTEWNRYHREWNFQWNRHHGEWKEQWNACHRWMKQGLYGLSTWMKREWNVFTAEWKSSSFSCRSDLEWNRCHNEWKSISFIHGSWSSFPMAAAVNTSCKWQLPVTAATQDLKWALLCLTLALSSSSRCASRWLHKVGASKVDKVPQRRQFNLGNCCDQFQKEYQRL